MTHPLYRYLSQWCDSNGWSDLFIERYQFWAFPPDGVLPMPLPNSVFEEFYLYRSQQTKTLLCYAVAILATVTAMMGTVIFHSPMPLVAAFASSAIAVGILDED